MMTRPTKTPLLDAIDTPADLRRLDAHDLRQVADELRSELIDAVSVTGGHLGAGLGVVELTVALHYVFNTPDDRIIWDVGHQAYPHKILTGRRDRIRTLRQGGGLSGFTKRAESEYDPFGAAHSSTSISAGLGMAVARDLDGRSNNVIAVIGDGAMSAGMAYEAMNNAGAQDSRLIVILNDNDMSIAPPVGAMSSYLSRLLSGRTYLTVRDIGRHVTAHLPKRIDRTITRAVEHARGFLTGGTLFGNSASTMSAPSTGTISTHLLPVLRNARDATAAPILIHVVTQKGKGYAPAEASADKYHGVNMFDVVTGAQVKAKANAPAYTRVFAESLTKAARLDDKIVAVTAAMPSGTGLDLFGQEFPTRTFDVGIAEQHAVTFAAGLATEGYKPFCAIYSTFLQRAYDQVVHDVALQGLPVRFAIDRAGLVGADGPTHAGLVRRRLSRLHARTWSSWPPPTKPSWSTWSRPPRPTIPAPSPSAIRAAKASASTCRSAAFRWKSARVACCAKDRRVALLSLGTRLAECLKAADELIAHGLSATVADARFAKPLDTRTGGTAGARAMRCSSPSRKARSAVSARS